MPISTKCASCGWTGKFKDIYAGMRGKCPGCGQPIQVPLEDLEEVEADYEIVDDDTPIKPLSSKKRHVEEDDRPAKNRRDDADERDRPSKSRRRDENEDQLPLSSGRPDDEDGPERSKRFKKVRKKTKKAREPKPLTGTAAMFGGIGVMIAAIAWFVLGIVSLDKIYFYPPFLFLGGVGMFIRGMQEEEEKYK